MFSFKNSGVLITDVSEGREKPKLSFSKKNRTQTNWFLNSIFILTAAIILTGFLLFFWLARVTVIIHPTIEKVSVLLNEGDFSNPFSSEISLTDRFPATGRLNSKNFARGNILVFNEFKKTSLIPSRFESSDGLIFLSQKKVVLTGPNLKNGKLTPGVTEVEVVAEKPGPEYNIKPTNFVLPALREAKSLRYTKIYGLSEAPMSGGSEAGVMVVTKEDIEEAMVNLLSRAWEDLEKTVSQKEHIIRELGRAEVVSFKTTINEGEEALAFNADLEVRLQAPVLTQAELTEKIFQEIGDGYILASGPSINGSRLEAQVYKEINEENLKKVLAGKTQAEARSFLLAKKDFNSIEIRFWPLWVRQFPKNTEAIKVRVKIF